jgi:DNA (cytosine-5)-methyltransferase 1
MLSADDASPHPGRVDHRAYGFSWTEGNQGIGWGQGVTPTFKGGSNNGIAPPPGVWLCEEETGMAIARPSIRTGERLQGFPAGSTAEAGSEGVRWKLVGNAVTVQVAKWLGERLVAPNEPMDVGRQNLEECQRWPWAASSVAGVREAWGVSERPLAIPSRVSLAVLLEQHGSMPLSLGATCEFTARLKASNLRSQPEFVAALDGHIRALQE